MLNRTQVQQALDAGGGLLRLEPGWVPCSFMVPGRRLKLHPDDVYALVSTAAVKNGVTIENLSESDPLILKHFGPGNPDAEPLKTRTK